MADTDRELRRIEPVRTSIARLLGVHRHERGPGVPGDRVAARMLGRFPDGWHVFHDIPVGDGDAGIDGLIVGPAGVFTVDTKNLNGKVWVASRSIRHNGHPTSFLHAAIAEAERASRLLSTALGRPIDVHPVLAILADEWTIKERPTDVFVAAPHWVTDWLLRQPGVLSPAEVAAICAIAANSSTWHRPAIDVRVDGHDLERL